MLISEVFGGDRYTATITCLTFDTTIATLYVIADIILVLSLMTIAWRMWRMRQTGFYFFPHQCGMAAIVALLFALQMFIDGVTIFDGVYRIEILIRSITAGVTVVFAFSFYVRR